MPIFLIVQIHIIQRSELISLGVDYIQNVHSAGCIIWLIVNIKVLGDNFSYTSGMPGFPFDGSDTRSHVCQFLYLIANSANVTQCDIWD